MTAIRTSLAFAIEDTFCGGPGKAGRDTGNQGKWLAAPPNSFFTHGQTRSTNRQNAAGTKKFDYIAYGGYTGSWSWSFTADYEYMEPLLAVFEEYTVEVDPSSSGADKYILTAPSVSMTQDTEKVYLSFSKLKETVTSPTANRLYWVGSDGTNRETAWVYDSGLSRWSSLVPADMTATAGLSADSLACLTPAYIHNGKKYTKVQKDTDQVALTDQTVCYTYKADRYLKDGTTSTLLADPVWFDASKYKAVKEDTTYYVADTDGNKLSVTGTRYKHTFVKADNGRVPTLCFRRVQLNQVVGGKHGDEILEIYGAFCTEFRMSVSAGSSQVQVNMSGYSAKEAMKITDLDSTEYKAYNGEHVMFACLFNNDSPSSTSYVADVQSLQVAVKNNAERLWSTCTPFITNYYEGITNYELTANVYSKDSTLFRQRMYTGGQDPDSEMANYQTAVLDDGTVVNYLKSPLCKGLVPMPAMTITSYDTCKETGQTIGDAISQSYYRFDIYATDIVFKQMSWERGDSSKILDNLSSAECRSMAFIIYSDVADYRNPAADRYLDIDKDKMIADNTS